MKLLWLTTLVISTVMAALDVERTVRQVQIILESNANLPRLSREEIVELLNDIIAEDAKIRSSSTENPAQFIQATTSFFSYDGDKEYPTDVNKPKTSYFGYHEKDNRGEDSVRKPTSYFNFADNAENRAAESVRTATSYVNYKGNDKNHAAEGIEITSYFNFDGNEIKSTKTQEPKENEATNDKGNIATIIPSIEIESTTKAEPNLMVVLPYTPRDGSSLQELYTKPPRTEVLPESKASPKPFTLTADQKIHKILQNNAKLASHINGLPPKAGDFPAELQAFLDSHGLKGKPGQDNFLLPLEGFKPLPPAKVVDGSVQLPENILLSYDLISPVSDPKDYSKHSGDPSTGFLYEPLRPEVPFELQASSSEKKKIILPYDMPTRNKKSPTTAKPNYDSIDYDSVRVIPLNKGPNPLDDDKYDFSNELNKRQTNDSVENTTPAAANDSTTVSSPTDDTKNAITNPPPLSDSQGSDSDGGASITDLEESFGGAAPEQPGDSELPPPRKNGFYWMLDWNSFLEVGDGDTKVNIRFEPKLGDPQMFLPVNVP